MNNPIITVEAIEDIALVKTIGEGGNTETVSREGIEKRFTVISRNGEKQDEMACSP